MKIKNNEQTLAIVSAMVDGAKNDYVHSARYLITNLGRVPRDESIYENQKFKKLSTYKQKKCVESIQLLELSIKFLEEDYYGIFHNTSVKEVLNIWNEAVLYGAIQ